ncbi:MAG TPA: M28 family peptidase [Bacteroidia bacterium]|nr:M28 family peptidase [Bacteroidia bacterium]HNT79522.1 M28 family peptidase [Bacteroidia bacterium]
MILNKINKLLLFLLLFSNASALAQKHSFDRASVLASMKQHIAILASDEFEGREAGTVGEQKTVSYISRAFTLIGIEEAGSQGYMQAFTFENARKVSDQTHLKINNTTLTLNTDYWPLPFNHEAIANATVVNVCHGIIAPDLKHDDYKKAGDVRGKIVVMEYYSPDGTNPHGKYAMYADVKQRIDSAESKGAVGVIFINTQKELPDPSMEYGKVKQAELIPVIFLKNYAAVKKKNTNADMKVVSVADEKNAYNVVGYIDNKAPTTIVIGAHLDHLGYGDEHSSLYRGEPAIHNGADDNASGIAALIELAQYFKKSPDKNSNYLFIAFSAEEKGLLGSKYFTNNPTRSIDSMSFMINMDMIGRLKTDDPVLIISGTGTSPMFNTVLDETSKSAPFKTKYSESGIGPSDHTSFYLKNVPCLHFFSGTHSDYHKPSDDIELINWNGMIDITAMIIRISEMLDTKGKIEFAQTKSSVASSGTRFKVTLGVVPDYAFNGSGMRIDGVSEGKPAAHAGLLTGDVVIQLGDIHVRDMNDYMKALGAFNKGDKTKVKVKRGEEELEKDIQF